MPVLKSFSALYVLILAILGPLLTKESKNIYRFMNQIFKWNLKPKVEAEEDVQSPSVFPLKDILQTINN